MLYTAGIIALITGGACIIASVLLFFFTGAKAAFAELRASDIYIPDAEDDESPIINDIYYDSHAEGFKQEKATPKFKKAEDDDAPAPERATPGPRRRDSTQQRPLEEDRYTAPLYEKTPSRSADPRRKSPVQRVTEPLGNKSRNTAPLRKTVSETAEETLSKGSAIRNENSELKRFPQEEHFTEPLITKTDAPGKAPTEGRSAIPDEVISEIGAGRGRSVQGPATEPLVVDEDDFVVFDDAETDDRVTEPLVALEPKKPEGAQWQTEPLREYKPTHQR